MKCPGCGAELQQAVVHDMSVLRCACCHGLWCARGELAEVIHRVPPLASVTVNTYSTSIGNCPNCDHDLRPFTYAHDSGIVLHRCRKCGGIWLTCGQLELLARFRHGTPSTRRLCDAVAEELRTNKPHPLRRLLRSRQLSACLAMVIMSVRLIAGNGPRAMLATFTLLVSALACIWFPDFLGRMNRTSIGLIPPKYIHETPGDAVAVGGWLLLLVACAVKSLR